MKDSSNIEGRNILFGIITAIVILQLLSDLMDQTPLFYTLIRFSLLFIIFNLVLKGYSWSKWILSIYLIIIGIGGIGISWYLITNRYILPENLKIGILAGIIGMLYILLSVTIHIPKDIKLYLTYEKQNREKFNFRNHLGGIFCSMGIAVIVCIEVKVLTIAIKNIIDQPKLILGGLVLLPLKLPLYAIPGLIMYLIGKRIEGEE